MRYVGDDYDKASLRAMLGFGLAAEAGRGIVGRFRTLLGRYRELLGYVRYLERQLGVEPRDLGPEPQEPAEAAAVDGVGRLVAAGVVHRQAQQLRLLLRHRAGVELGPDDVVRFGFDGSPRVPVVVWGEDAERLGLVSNPALTDGASVPNVTRPDNGDAMAGPA
jgi:hypothetical protein